MSVTVCHHCWIIYVCTHRVGIRWIVSFLFLDSISNAKLVFKFCMFTCNLIPLFAVLLGVLLGTDATLCIMFLVA